MKLPHAILITVVLMMISPVVAGTISGNVRAEGKPETSQEGGLGKYDSHAFKFAQRVDYSAMHDFIVYLEGPVGTNPVVVPEKPLQVITKKTVSQRKAMFYPHVLPVIQGTTVEWPNNDEIFHNVFSDSETKSFDLGLYKAPEVKRVTFDKPGRVDIFCSIHASMNCIVLVLENPYFATTDEKGNYSIQNVPAGTYKIKAWHERLPALRQEIKVSDNGDVKMDFTLGIKGLPKI